MLSLFGAQVGVKAGDMPSSDTGSNVSLGINNVSKASALKVESTVSKLAGLHEQQAGMSSPRVTEVPATPSQPTNDYYGGEISKLQKHRSTVVFLKAYDRLSQPTISQLCWPTGQAYGTETQIQLAPSFRSDFTAFPRQSDVAAPDYSSVLEDRNRIVDPLTDFHYSEPVPDRSRSRTSSRHGLTNVVQRLDTVSGIGLKTVLARQKDSSRVTTFRGANTLSRKETAVHRERVYPNVKVWINSFIPLAKVNGPPLSDCFLGDNRKFSNAIHASSRTHQEIEIRPDLTPLINWKRIGTTHELDCKTDSLINSGTASRSEVTNGPIVAGRTSAEALIHFSGAASNPLVRAAPAIDFDALFRINMLHRTCSLEIEHDGFPAYEAYVTAGGGAGVPVYRYDPTRVGEGISALFPPMDKSASTGPIQF